MGFHQLRHFYAKGKKQKGVPSLSIRFFALISVASKARVALTGLEAVPLLDLAAKCSIALFEIPMRHTAPCERLQHSYDKLQIITGCNSDSITTDNNNMFAIL